MRHAEVAQLVEHHLAMVGVAGSNPVFRSGRGPIGGMAEWLGKGLQNPAPRFDSGCRLSERTKGRLAQGESAFLTRRRSVVRIHYRPLLGTLDQLSASLGSSLLALHGAVPGSIFFWKVHQTVTSNASDGLAEC